MLYHYSRRGVAAAAQRSMIERGVGSWEGGVREREVSLISATMKYVYEEALRKNIVRVNIRFVARTRRL